MIYIIHVFYAHGSVPHKLILHAFEHFHVPQPVASVVCAYFDGLSLSFSTKKVESRQFPCEVGIAMGCSISPTLFVMAMEILLAPLDGVLPTVDLGNGQKVGAVKAFMDDVALLSTDPGTLENGLSEFSRLVTWARMKFKAKKSRCVSLRKGKVVQNTTFCISGESIPNMASQPIKSLGREYNHRLNDSEAIRKASADFHQWLSSIDESKLSGVQKAWCYNFIVMPKVL